MQKVPILPTTPWQGGDPQFSNPSVTVTPAANPAKQPVIWREPNRSDYQAQLRVHRALVSKPSRSAVPTGVPRKPLVHVAAKTGRLSKIRRHRVVFIFKAPITPTAFVTAETIKHVYVRSVTRLNRHKTWLAQTPALIARPATTGSQRDTVKHVLTRPVTRLRQQRRLAKNPAVILRSLWFMGVRREKTVKPIYLHSVGKFEHVAKHRGHRARIAKAGLRVSTPLGRIQLRPLDRTTQGRFRRHRYAFIFKSRGGVATVTTEATVKHIYVQMRGARARVLKNVLRHEPIILRSAWFMGVPRAKTIKPVYVRSVTRLKQLATHRRHKVLVQRNAQRLMQPLYRVLVHPVSRKRSARLRRHRLLFQHGPFTVQTNGGRRVFVPVTTKDSQRQRARRRRHLLGFVRSSGGISLTQVIYIEPFDQPTPTGRASSMPTAGAYDIPIFIGRTSSSPTSGAFDIPTPIGETDIPDPER